MPRYNTEPQSALHRLGIVPTNIANAWRSTGCVASSRTLWFWCSLDACRPNTTVPSPNLADAGPNLAKPRPTLVEAKPNKVGLRSNMAAPSPNLAEASRTSIRLGRVFAEVNWPRRARARPASDQTWSGRAQLRPIRPQIWTNRAETWPSL